MRRRTPSRSISRAIGTSLDPILGRALRYIYGGSDGGEHGPGPVAVAVLAGVEAVGRELPGPRRLEVRRYLGHRQAPGAGGLVQGPVDPGQVGPAGPAEQARVAGRYRQVEHDGAVRHRREQRAKVAEQLSRPAVQDV